MQCPRCESNYHRKNGHANGKQRYQCKACGKQFMESHYFGQRSNNAVIEEFTFQENVEVNYTKTTKTTTKSEQGIAILLLDAENIKLDTNTEKFCASIGKYPLQVKMAFADWKNPSMAKQDIELHERGYQLIHVPGGKDSADGKMIAVGSSIFLQYPLVKEVFICSSDWIFTHLCNELQNQGLTVYRVQRDKGILHIENCNTGEFNYYSLERKMPIPSFDEFIERIENFIKVEQESLQDRLATLSTIAYLFQTRCKLLSEQNSYLNSLDAVLEREENNQVLEQQLHLPENCLSQNYSILDCEKINSQEELEQAIINILKIHQKKLPAQNLTIPELSHELKTKYGESANVIIKKLKINSTITNYLTSSPIFTVNKNNSSYEVMLSEENNITIIKSANHLEKTLLNILNNLIAKSKDKQIDLGILRSEFHKQYGQPITTVLKQLKLNDNFLFFIESRAVFKVDKVEKSYRVAIAP